MDALAPWLDSSSTMLVHELRPEVEVLLRTLLGLLGTVGDAPPWSDPGNTRNGGEVLLNAEIEGTRFVLLSIAPPCSAERPTFSPREIEIARMVAKGYANKTIATVLDISVNTVNTHLRRIFAKLGVTTRAAMVTSLASHYSLADVLESGRGAPGRPKELERRNSFMPMNVV